jgi:hypothetical protein
MMIGGGYPSYCESNESGVTLPSTLKLREGEEGAGESVDEFRVKTHYRAARPVCISICLARRLMHERMSTV